MDDSQLALGQAIQQLCRLIEPQARIGNTLPVSELLVIETLVTAD